MQNLYTSKKDFLLLDATTVCSVARMMLLCWREDRRWLVVRLGEIKSKAAQVWANITLNTLSDILRLFRENSRICFARLLFYGSVYS